MMRRSLRFVRIDHGSLRHDLQILPPRP
jgi:hypothetical protein